MKKINALVVDDSTYMRTVISDILKEDPDFGTVSIARDGEDALKKVVELKPDVITLDLVMPKMGGMDALDYIMSDQPTPVVIVSALTKKESHETFEALDHGAVDFVSKPSGMISLDMASVAEELRKKVKEVSRVDVSQFTPRELPVKKISKIKDSLDKTFEKIVVIASSTGGPPALSMIMSQLPADLPVPILIIQHMPAGFTKSFADRISKLGGMKAKEAQEPDHLMPGNVYVAPGGFHMEIKIPERQKTKGHEGIVTLNKKAPVLGLRPVADITMESVAKAYGKDVIGVVLTGMGHDGTEGMKAIKDNGGMTIAQDEGTSVVFGMPKEAIASGCVDKVLPLQEIAGEIVRFIKEK